MTGPASAARIPGARTVEALSQDPVRVSGHIVDVSPQSFRVAGLSPYVRLGDCISCQGPNGPELGEVVRVEEHAATVKPFAVRFQSGVRTLAWKTGPITISPSPAWRGRTVNAFGHPCDDKGPIEPGEWALATDTMPDAAMRRGRVKDPVPTGVSAIDLFTPLVRGQRMGIFAGSGVGKSTLLGMLARSQGFDTVVVALVGERGREVREFLEETMQGDLAKVVTVVATGDESAMMRRLAPKTAMTVAEYFRDRGDHVLLIVDSITRLAFAARDVALAAGEPPVARGYPPSVFSDLPRLLERAGPGAEGGGTITGLFAVLVDGDDHNEPVADAIRGTLDGHIVLDRAIAAEGRFPAVDVLKSISRLADLCWSATERDLMGRLRAMIARFEDTRDLRLLGGYQRGADPILDQAVDLVPRIYAALSQHPRDPAVPKPFEELSRHLKAGLTPG
ncbi:FliI/YscN family ATPase [Aureimonas jatrophae]|uniref:Flagellum-specific ATP synthase n=1 Tax=Aureimonas jatrophae TaxID=1166073 RepID=A0A1H0JEW1_9HYPH|nr:FliI/YscN family ATPase [Aureimonas jatrophae]MBB3951456.1 flagellum-specific ATP synthase [Aureimonas jatrophae]SDO41891.1 flagellum-specific ATP synthase [Aureimonas jatrophae]